MKKFGLCLLLVLAMFVSALFFVGCGTPNNSVLANLSDIRYGVFDAKNENAIASFVYGQREQNYSPDGKCSALTDFGIISVSLLKKYDKSEIPFTIFDGINTISGNLEKSPYENKFLADIGKQITQEPLELTLNINNEEIKLELNKKSDNFEIKYEQALDIGKDALKEEISKNNNKHMEFQLKIISQNEIEFGKYFWQFCLICEDGQTHTVTFSVQNPEILVKN